MIYRIYCMFHLARFNDYLEIPNMITSEYFIVVFQCFCGLQINSWRRRITALNYFQRTYHETQSKHACHFSNLSYLIISSICEATLSMYYFHAKLFSDVWIWTGFYTEKLHNSNTPTIKVRLYQIPRMT